MCGIVGIYSENPEITAEIAYCALFSLQHRGQESTGIGISYGGEARVHKGMGLVTTVFTPDVLKKIGNGKVAVGHVRYSTTGESRIENAQPLLVHSKVGSIAVAHNGNLVNYWKLRRTMESEGRAFLTDSDTEVIAQLLSAILLENDIVDSLKLLDARLVGSYALVILYNDTLIAYRDPLGIRPLCIGKADFGYVIASESCAIDSTGAKLLRDVKPGEAVIIQEGDIDFVKVTDCSKKAFCVFEYIYFARPDSIIDGKSVYKIRYNIGKILAEESGIDADIVSPVPDSGTTSAIGFSISSGIPYLEALIKNRYVGRTFIMPEQWLREKSVRLKMNVVKENVKGRRVILVDDSIVRGTTSRKIVDLIREAGAKEVHFRVGSPPIVAPCYMGIDMSTREELIASSRSIEEIRRTIHADSLAYLSLEGLLKAVGAGEDELCLACLTGKYPIQIPGEV
ncbi:MAG: amidophosphoribosyltransferase [Archaeoglobus sp.]|nr:MAG: amidophosphoribosyltransferase [Archaeoglobus sp.]